MNWFDQLGGVLQQYAGGSSQDSRSPEDDFDQVSTVAPREAVSGGLAEAFRSGETPPFPNMLGDLFGRSDGQQRASILNTLLASAGPALLSAMMSRGGGGLGSLAGMLGGASAGTGTPQVTPEQAQQIPPQAVEELARETEKKDPSIIDHVSDFYAEHPTLVKSLGAAALAIAMKGMAGQKRGLF